MMRNRMGSTGLARVTPLVAAVFLASTSFAGGAAETKSQKPAAAPQSAAAPQQAGAQGHQGHEGHSMPGMKPETQTEDVMGKAMTIVGEVMDPACFLEAGVKSIGPGHFQCAVDCAKSGQTLAIYDRDQDRIYFIAGELPGKNPNAPLFRFIHKKVDVNGVVYHRSGAYGIVITKVVLHEEKAGARTSRTGAGAAQRKAETSSALADSAKSKAAGM